MPTDTDTLVQIPVRDLVAFVLRSGDLGSAFLSANRAVEGTRGHRFVQDQRPEEYRSEVPVRCTVDAGGSLSLQITGRVDGVLHDGGDLLVEEIKTTYGALEERPDNPLHWGQAKTYAHILAQDLRPQRVEVRLTYVQLDSGQVLEDGRPFTPEELAAFFDDLVGRYLRWARAWHEWCGRRDASIENLAFPFPEYRPGQQELSEAVRETIASEGRLFAMAPTGIGKTMSVLFPAVRALGEGQVEKVFYLTAKTSGRTVAESALDDLRASGLRLKSCTITARDRICFNARGGRPCDMETCEFALGYYDRVNDALEDAFRTHDDFTRTHIEETARKHTVCPFELGLDLSLLSDVLICDYNYVFDPKAYLKRYFLESSGDYAFLVDEAHNLVERARDMYSAEIRRGEVRAMIKALGESQPAIVHVLGTLDLYLAAQLRRCDDEGDGRGWLDREPPEDLLPLLTRVQAEIEPVLARNRPAPWREALTDLFFTIAAFLRVADLFDGRYVTYGEKRGRGDLLLRLFCLDPSGRIGQALDRGRSATFFSATLTPLDYFRRLLGGGREDFTLQLDSPFPRENLLVMVADHIDTSYRGRGRSYDDVAAAIAAAVGDRRGNYMVYFPSYKYLQEVLPRFRGRGAARHSRHGPAAGHEGGAERAVPRPLPRRQSDHRRRLRGHGGHLRRGHRPGGGAPRGGRRRRRRAAADLPGARPDPRLLRRGGERRLRLRLRLPGDEPRPPGRRPRHPLRHRPRAAAARGQAVLARRLPGAVPAVLGLAAGHAQRRGDPRGGGRLLGRRRGACGPGRDPVSAAPARRAIVAGMHRFNCPGE